jgi:membrane protease YdiL (CAAX protease family)
VVFSFLGAITIWALDYFLQVYIFHIDINEIADQWYTKNSRSKMIFTFASSVLFAPMIEEILFRGMFLQALNQYLNKFWSAIVLSGLFALIHFDLTQSASLFIAALMYTWLTYKSNSVIPAICAHIINNFLTFIYYLDLVALF